MLKLYQSLSIKAIAAISLATMTSLVNAVPTSEKYDVLKQASNYAQSVACYTSFSPDTEGLRTSVKDVYLVETSSSDDINEFGSKYVVFWGGDYGCAGGSGTYSFYLTVLSRMSENNPFLVIQDDILEDINESEFQINTRFIEDVKFHNGVFIITASDYSDIEEENMGDNFPVNRYQYTVTYNDNEYKWVLANKKFLGKNKF